MAASRCGSRCTPARPRREAAGIYRAAGLKRELSQALVGLSSVLQAQGDLANAALAASEGLEIARDAGDLRTEASATGNLAIIALKQGRIEEAEPGILAAVSLFRRAGDEHAVVIGLGNLGAIAFERQDYAAAKQYAQDAAASAQRLRSVPLEGWALVNLAQVLSRTGEWSEAREHLLSGLPIIAEADDWTSLFAAFDVAGILLAHAGDPKGAATTWATAAKMAARRNLPLERDATHLSEMHSVDAVLGPIAVAEAAREGDVVEPENAASVILERVRSIIP